MSFSILPESENVTVSERCPGCATAWSDAPVCARCGLEKEEARGLLVVACASYEMALQLAKEGRFADARTPLADACAGGLADHPAVRRLTELLVATLGETGVSESLAADYETAREKALEGRFDEAVTLAHSVVEASPALFPAWRLHTLCLKGAKRTQEALPLGEIFPSLLITPLPMLGEGDESKASRERASTERAVRVSTLPLVRLREKGIERPARKRRPPRLVEPPPAPVPSRMPFFVGGAVALALAAQVLSVVALSFSLRKSEVLPATGTPAPLVTPTPAATPSPMPTATPTPTPMPSPTLAPPLAREYEETRRAANERLARQWFHQALRAKQQGEDREAIRLTEAAHSLLEPDSYLVSEVLLVWAQASDNLDTRDAAERYADLAKEAPNSAYAPMGLQKAAAVARRQGRPEEAQLYRNSLLASYPASDVTKRVWGH